MTPLDQLDPPARSSLQRCLQGTGRIPLLAREAWDTATDATEHAVRLCIALGLFAGPLLMQLFAAWLAFFSLLGLVRAGLHSRRAYVPGRYLLPSHVCDLWADRLTLHPVKAILGPVHLPDDLQPNELVAVLDDDAQVRFRVAGSAEVEAAVLLGQLGAVARLSDRQELSAALDPLADTPDSAADVGAALDRTMPAPLVLAHRTALVLALLVLPLLVYGELSARARVAAEAAAAARAAADRERENTAARQAREAAQAAEQAARLRTFATALEPAPRTLLALARDHRDRASRPLALPVAWLVDAASVAAAQRDTRRTCPGSRGGDCPDHPFLPQHPPIPAHGYAPSLEPCFAPEARSYAAHLLAERFNRELASSPWDGLVQSEPVTGDTTAPAVLVRVYVSLPPNTRDEPYGLRPTATLQWRFEVELRVPGSRASRSLTVCPPPRPFTADLILLHVRECQYTRSLDAALDALTPELTALLGITAAR